MTNSSSSAKVDVVSIFSDLLKLEPDTSTAIAAIRTLTVVLKQCSAQTLQELLELLRSATEVMIMNVDCSAASVTSGCDLFLRFITLASDSLEQDNFNSVRQCMLSRGRIFVEKLSEARPKISKLGARFIQEGYNILIHSHSRTVLATLKEAHLNKKLHFHVFVTQSVIDQPQCNGDATKIYLESLGISCTVILDAAVCSILGIVDIVLMGAEGVVENGGIINRIGSYTIASCAKQLNKPVYIVCESFKFVRMFPLNQQDIPDNFKYAASTLAKLDSKGLSKEHSLVDYTPPKFIALLVTDLGVLTPSAVSDELLKLYT